MFCILMIYIDILGIFVRVCRGVGGGRGGGQMCSSRDKVINVKMFSENLKKIWYFENPTG